VKAVVIGYGSIGRRHAQILRGMHRFDEIAVLSQQKNLDFTTIRSLEDVRKLNPSYIVVASNTMLHFEHLQFLEENLQEKKILVEKPIFDSIKPFKPMKNEVYVGYNLRFHPMMEKVKSVIATRPLWYVQVDCRSFLPTWRVGRDYRETSSAKRDLGGGVLLDLSHELDYVQWLFGSLVIDHAVNKKVSNLEINSDDMLLLAGHIEGSAHIQISLNYFCKTPSRQLFIDGESLSIKADLIANTLSVFSNGEKQEYSWPSMEKDFTYLEQHHAVLSGDLSRLCSFSEGMKTIQLIDQIRTRQ
jgi:predicted dehydrogenase